MPDRPWCCPEPRCLPLYQAQGGNEPLSTPQPGEMFICFGKAPAEVEFIYDGARHVNDLRQCSYTALKGLIAFQENADDWRGLQNAYGRALRALEAHAAAPQPVDQPKCNGRDPAYSGRCPLPRGHVGGCFGDQEADA